MPNAELDVTSVGASLAQKYNGSQVGALTIFTEWLAKSVMGKEPDVPFRFSVITSGVKEHINSITPPSNTEGIIPTIAPVPGIETQIQSSTSSANGDEKFNLAA